MQARKGEDDPFDSERILVLAPTARDGQIACDQLAETGLRGVVCRSMDSLCEEIARGASAALVSEDELVGHGLTCMQRVLAAQPPWSDFPLLVLASRRAPRERELGSGPLETLGNVTLLDPPLRVRTLVRAAHSAIRARRRQHEGRRAIDERDRFLAMLGHELRNPLSAIALAVEMVERQPSLAERSLPVLRRQVKHLTRLVDDLLDVARVSSGKIQLERRLLDLGAVVARSLELVRVRFEDAGIDVRLADARGLVVEGDPVRLEQVFGNLLTNAVKYTGRGGLVTIDLRAERGFAVVTVTDTGVGIDPDFLPRIFDQFVQSESTLARSQGGMGVGLTLVRTLVTLHGGTVSASSAGVGHGSQFTVHLPTVDAKYMSVESEPSAAGLSGPRSIVLVEDNADARELLASALRELGCTVAVAADGEEGLALFSELRPQAAVLDIGLPKLTGYEVAQRVRALDDEAVLIAVTGYGQPEDRQRALDAGFDAHMTKPIDVAHLGALLAGAFARRESARQV